MRDNHSCHILLIGEHSGPDTDCWNDLSAQNSPVLFTNSGREAIALLIEYAVFLIVIDVEQDSSQGMYHALFLRSSDRFKNIPILFLLPGNPPSDWQWPMATDGPIDYLIKPVNRFLLFQKTTLFLKYVDLIKEKTERHDETLHTKVFKHIPVPLILIDRNGKILDANVKTVSFAGYPDKEVDITLNETIFIHPVFVRPGISDFIKGILDGKQDMAESVPLAGPGNQSLSLVNLKGKPIMGPDGVTAAILMIEDLSAKLKTEEALVQSSQELAKANEELQRLTENLEQAIEKANQSAVEAEMATITKSSFLASMSHEIRTPLNAVIGFTELALETDLNEEQREYIESIRSASGTFLELINDILDFSKIEANMVSLESIPFIIEECLSDVVGTLWMKAREKNLDLAYRIAPDVPSRVSGDPVRFKQIVMNLVGNAIKFTSEGQVVIRITCETMDNALCTLHLSVSDSGIGIPESRMTKLFKPFSQVSEQTNREYGGTGLGLAISKQLVGLMNGDIWIQSPNPESVGFPGTLFHVRIRFGLDVPDQFKRPKYNGLAGKRVLVCERNPVILKLFCDILSDDHMISVPVRDPDKLKDVLREESHSGHEVTDILLDASFEGTDMAGIASAFNGRIILMGYPDRHRTLPVDSSDDNDLRIVRIKKPVRLSVLRDILSHSDHEPDEDSHESIDMDLSGGQTKVCKILLVEDNKINQKVTLKMLDRLGYRAVLAENGRDAIAIMDQDKDVDLILMDGQMPVMDGFQATEIIRRREKEDSKKSHIPIIALTANALKGDERKYLESGMDDYIAKPVKLTDLSDAITKAMDQFGVRSFMKSDDDHDQDAHD